MDTVPLGSHVLVGHSGAPLPVALVGLPFLMFSSLGPSLVPSPLSITGTEQCPATWGPIRPWVAWLPCLARLPVYLPELTNREAQGLSCVMGQRDSHPGKQGQQGPNVHLGPHPTPLPCQMPALPVSAAPKGLQCVWLPHLSAITTS